MGFCVSLLVLFNNIYEFNHSSSQFDMIYLKSDSVPHNELLFKLRTVGVSEDLWLWFQSYVSGRQQFVSIGSSNSKLLPVVFEGTPR